MNKILLVALAMIGFAVVSVDGISTQRRIRELGQSKANLESNDQGGWNPFNVNPMKVRRNLSRYGLLRRG